MSLPVTMPRLSETMVDGKLLYWCVAVGDFVRAGEAIAEIEADKANMEIEAPQDGVVTAFHAMPGDTVPVDGVLAELDVNAEAPASEPKPRSQSGQEAPDVAARKVSPLAARLAHQHGITAEELTGTGPGGMVTVEDVEKARAS